MYKGNIYILYWSHSKYIFFPGFNFHIVLCKLTLVLCQLSMLTFLKTYFYECRIFRKREKCTKTKPANHWCICMYYIWILETQNCCFLGTSGPGTSGLPVNSLPPFPEWRRTDSNMHRIGTLCQIKGKPLIHPTFEEIASIRRRCVFIFVCLFSFFPILCVWIHVLMCSVKKELKYVITCFPFCGAKDDKIRKSVGTTWKVGDNLNGIPFKFPFTCPLLGVDTWLTHWFCHWRMHGGVLREAWCQTAYCCQANSSWL